MVYFLLHIDRARYQIGKLVQNRGQLSTASLIGSIRTIFPRNADKMSGLCGGIAFHALQ